MTNQILFLGTGGSMGVPVIGCHCDVCGSEDPNNHRLRTSALLNVGGKRLLIDAGPDFRQQALKHHIDDLDGVILTHSHYDHIGGLDELRIFFFKHAQPLPGLVSESTAKELRARHSYLFKEPGHKENIPAQLDFQVLSNVRGKVTFCGVELQYMTYQQGGVDVLGLRLGDFAYISDIRDYEESLFEDLKGVQRLVLSALRETPSHVHFSVEEAVVFAKKVGAEETWFIHMAHELDHHKTNDSLPDGFELTYDGLTLKI